MQSVLTAKCLDIETVVITVPKLNKNKQLSAGIINSKTKSAVYIETPYLINPFGVTSYDGGKAIADDQRTYSLSVKAAGGQNENTDDIKTLFDFLKALDEKVIDYCQVNSQQIFKKKYEVGQRSILADLLFNRGVKPSVAQDGTVYPDKITLKIMKNEQLLPDVLVFKDSEKPLDFSGWDSLQNIIPKGVAIKVIMQPKIYFVNGKAGINFRVLQVKLPNFERVGRPVTYAFSEPPQTEVPISEPIKVVSENKTSNVEDSDEDAEDSEVEVDA
jgi:hypothetical protein